jgi:hypothetical protein
MTRRSAFLDGDRHDDVALFLSESYLDGQAKLRELGEAVDSGCVLVVPGDDGRRAFSAGTGMDAMEFARGAMETRGHISRDLDGGECPARHDGDAAESAEHDASEGADGHRVAFVFAFSEAENPEVGGLYARGDVIHAYAHCTCGTNYSDKWVVGEEGDTGVQPGGTQPVEATGSSSR